MTTTDDASLTDRYLHAVARAAPERQRDGLRAEVRERIADELDARLAAGEPADTAERAVLTGLGDPMRLVAAYLARPSRLIGPRYYFTWLRLLRLVLVIALPFVALAAAIVGGIDRDPVGTVIGSVIWTTISAGIQICFWVTLVFALLDRFGDRLSDGHLPEDATWDLDRLPPVERGERMPRAELITGIVLGAVLIALLVAQQFVPFAWHDRTAIVPLLDPALWSFWLPYLLAVIVAGLALSIATYRRGRRTWWTAAANTALVLAFSVPGLWLWSTGGLLAPGVVDAIGLGDRPETVRTIGIVLAVIWVAIAAWSVIDGFRRAHVTGRR